MTTNLNKEQIIETAGKCAVEFKKQGYHCSESIIRAVPLALGFTLPADAIRCACAFHGGGGGTGGRCGVVESSLMIIAYLYGRMHPFQSLDKEKDVVQKLMRQFKEEFASLECKDIKAAAVKAYGPEFGCQEVYEKGAMLITRILLEAEE